MEETMVNVPYVVLESERARHERERKHERTLWFVLSLVLILLLFGTNAAWIAYESQFTDEVNETYTSDATDGGIALVNRDGVVNYGEGDLYQNDTQSP